MVGAFRGFSVSWAPRAFGRASLPYRAGGGQRAQFAVPSTEIRGSKKSFRPSSTREGVIGNSGVAISWGNGWKLLRASLRRSASTSAVRAAAWLVSKAPIASTNATPVSAMPAASVASVCNFIIDQTPGLIFLRSAYEAGGGAHRPRPAWSSARPLPICRQPAVAAPLAHYVPEARKG